MYYNKVAIDSSLNAPSFYFPNVNQWVIFIKKGLSKKNEEFISELNKTSSVKIHYFHDKGNDPINILKRSRQIEETLQFILPQVEEVQIEGLSFGSNSLASRQIAGFHYLVLNLFKNATKITESAPSAVKKIFTGDGKAEKVDMINKFIETYTIDPELIVKISEYMSNKTTKSIFKPIDDIVDSFAISKCGWE